MTLGMSGEHETEGRTPNEEPKRRFALDMINCMAAVVQVRLALEALHNRLIAVGLVEAELRAVEMRAADIHLMLVDLTATARDLLKVTLAGDETKLPPADESTLDAPPIEPVATAPVAATNKMLH